MRKFVTLILMVSTFMICSSYQAKAVNTATIPIENAVLQPTVGDIVDMNAREFAQYTGQKFSLKQRIAFGLIKSHLKHDLHKGKLSADDSALNAMAAGSSSFNFGAFILGFLLGIIGLLIVLLAFKDKGAWKYALYGWLAAIVLIVLVVVL